MCVLHINLSVLESLGAIRHEIELSLVLTCPLTAAFCVRASNV